MLTIIEIIVHLIIYITFLALVGTLIYRRVKEMYDAVTMAKAYHLHNQKLPSVKQVDRALTAFRKSYQKKLKTQKMDVEDDSNEHDPSYGNMYQ